MPDIDRLIEAWEIFRDSNPYEICNGREFRAIKEPDYCMGRMIENTIAMLKEQKTVVRCRDCKFARICLDAYKLKHVYKCMCHIAEECHDADWYCADGERK